MAYNFLGYIKKLLTNKIEILKIIQDKNQDDVLDLWHSLMKIKKMHIGKPYSLTLEVLQ